MATGGTVDYSSICLVVALHKTPRYAVVKKVELHSSHMRLLYSSFYTAGILYESSEEEFHLVFRVCHGGLAHEQPVCFLTHC